MENLPSDRVIPNERKFQTQGKPVKEYHRSLSLEFLNFIDVTSRIRILNLKSLSNFLRNLKLTNFMSTFFRIYYFYSLDQTIKICVLNEWPVINQIWRKILQT